MEKTSQLNRLKEGLAGNRGVLILGQHFGHGIEQLDVDGFLEDNATSVGDRSGWENSLTEEKMSLLIHSTGSSNVAQKAASHFPTPKALEEYVTDFHRALVSLPFAVIVDTTATGFACAALRKSDARIRFLRNDQDLVTRPNSFYGERTIVQIRGDLWTEDPALTTQQTEARLAKNPGLHRFVRNAITEGPVLIYGMNFPDAEYSAFHSLIGPYPGTTIMATKLGNSLWRQELRQRGIFPIDAPSWGELQNKMSGLFRELSPASAVPDLTELIDEIDDHVSKSLANHELLSWANRDPQELEDLPADEVWVIKESVRLMTALAERGIMVPSVVSGLAAEICLRVGDPPLARQALSLSVRCLNRTNLVNPDAASCIGRTLNRMGDFPRARHYLQLALVNRSDDQISERADDLAWLSRCIIQEIDSLNGRGRERAVMEMVADFLRSQSKGVALAEVQTDDEHTLRSIYYINLRLGRIMAMASKLAQSSSDIFASKAVEMLTRAISFEPTRPDGYKAIRPLLTDKALSTADSEKWMSLVSGAPPAVQRRITSR